MKKINSSVVAFLLMAFFINTSLYSIGYKVGYAANDGKLKEGDRVEYVANENSEQYYDTNPVLIFDGYSEAIIIRLQSTGRGNRAWVLLSNPIAIENDFPASITMDINLKNLRRKE